MEQRTSKVGWVLFGLYLLLYGGFVLINAFAPEVMEKTPIPDINLAVIYGFTLIISACVFALIYGVASRGSNDNDA